jgi:predicted phage terminase large subunit-like protein
MDDMHNPDEVTSDVLRNRVINIYQNTLKQRARSPAVPFVFVGQITHEDDLPNQLKNGIDGHEWKIIRLQSIDEAGNVLNPRIHPKEDLLKLQEFSPYVFATQYQQQSVPAGGAIFKKVWFMELDQEPKLIGTFITGDTAETTDTHNDKTVFSFWGLYEIIQKGINTKTYGLHWLDCVELQVEPRFLETEFLQFYVECCRHDVKPAVAAIEKKSTGVTLVSVLKPMQGIHILEVERPGGKGNKTTRFLSMQPFIAKHQVTFPRGARHTKMCVEHMGKITANNTHRWDDICDTAYDAIKLGLIDKVLNTFFIKAAATGQAEVLSKLQQNQRTKQEAIRGAINSWQ